MGQRWESNDMELKSVYKSDSSDTTKTWHPRMSIQGNILCLTLRKTPTRKGFCKICL